MKKTLCILIFISFLSAVNCYFNLAGKVQVKPFSAYQQTTAAAQEYGNVWDALQGCAFDQLAQFAMTEEQNQFAEGLAAVVDGRNAEAIPQFEKLIQTAGDSAVLVHARYILKELYCQDYAWEKAAQIEEMRAVQDSLNEICLIRALIGTPVESWFFPDQPVVMPTAASFTGAAQIEVLINDRKAKFWIDTGASHSVLASDFAEKSGVIPISQDEILAGTATNATVGIKPALIDRMEIGGLVIENHPALIIDKKDLEFKLFGMIRLVKIDGIIGWNAISRMKMTIDLANKTTTLEKPVEADNPNPNLIWLGTPFVKMTSSTGRPLLFDLDTGANTTSLADPILSKIDTAGIEKSKNKIGGAGGFQTFETVRLAKLDLVLGENLLTFRKIDTNPNLKHDFFLYDGRLGGDVMQAGPVVLDFVNRKFELIRSNDR